MSSEGNNAFLDEDEVDDFTFLSHPKQGFEGYLLENEYRQPVKSDWETKQMQFLEEKRRIEESTLQSSKSSLALLHEAEDVGILTAEELVQQRQQLQNVEGNLDKINSTMRISQKHINSIKSMFGGIKNYFSRSGTPDPSLPSSVSSSNSTTPKLQETLGSLRAAENKSSEVDHPALKIRGLISPEYVQSNDDASEFRSGHQKLSIPREQGPSPASGSESLTQDFDEQLNRNLSDMSLGLGRLKSLAIGLHDEIDLQNVYLDRIHTKADRADESLEHQNRQIKRILKK